MYFRSFPTLIVPWLVAAALIPAPLSAQRFSESQISRANTASNCAYLSPEERNVVLYLNLARHDGPTFLAQYILPHITEENLDPVEQKYLISLLAELRQTRNLPPLYPDPTLTLAARDHARDLAQSRTFAHRSADGTSYPERIARYLTDNQYIAANECLATGYHDGLMTVIQLLIDQNVVDLGHRKALLDPEMRYLGVSTLPHPSHEWVSVLEFASHPVLPNAQTRQPTKAQATPRQPLRQPGPGLSLRVGDR